MEKTDREIIEGYLSGEKESFDLIVGRYTGSIFNFVKRLQGNADDAADITQEVFVKVWKNIKYFDSEKSFKTWIFTIARNTTIDWLRKKKTYVFSELNRNEDDDFESNIEDTSPLQDELFAQKESKEILEKSLDLLTIDQKTVILLHDIEGLTFEEASETLNKPLNTVKSHYRRGIGKLREEVEKNNTLHQIINTNRIN